MADQTNANADWTAALQQAQADMLRQWTDMSQSWMRGSTGTPAAAASGDSAEGVTHNFLQQCEQYLGVSRSLWDLVTRAAVVNEPEQRARLFADGLGGLQQQFAGLWAATPFGAPAWPGGFPGSAFNMPSLGPAREQQESWRRLTQLSARCAQAQLQVSGQWNDIIGRALHELGERLAPRLSSGKGPGSMQEIYDLWVDSAESVYAQAARGAAFVQAQAELTNSMSQLRSAQRELLEEWAKQFDLPTRAELNSIHQQLRDLKAALAGGRN